MHEPNVILYACWNSGIEPQLAHDELGTRGHHVISCELPWRMTGICPADDAAWTWHILKRVHCRL